MTNLLGEPPETLLPADPAADAGDRDPRQVAKAYPASSLAWAVLAEQALADGSDVEAYAFARTGYHRGLDLLRRSGWKGHGPIPWGHEPNRGFLRALTALADTSERVGDEEEAHRCREFLRESSAEAYRQLVGGDATPEH
ncbi:MAG: DUF3151 domain-containing protein [Nocardioidaceae bacterium]